MNANTNVAILVVNERGAPLMVSRKSGQGVCMPGGKVDEGETPLQAALRELEEETGLSAVSSGMLVLMNDVCLNEDGSVGRTISYFATKWSGQLAGEELLDARWGTWNDLCFNSPFGEYNQRLAQLAVLPMLSKGVRWSPKHDQMLDQLSEVL